jgi:DNA-binding MarR family transcriptional regulator
MNFLSMIWTSCILARSMADWTFLTNHAHALLCVAREPGMRLRDIAECVGITERAAHRLVDDLCQEGYLTRHRMGRRSFYEIHPHARLRHPLESDVEIGDVLALLLRDKRGKPRAA